MFCSTFVLIFLDLKRQNNESLFSNMDKDIDG